MFALLAAVSLMETARHRSWLPLNMALVYVSLFPAVALHELGHLLAGLLMRMRILRIQIGTGRPLFQRRVCRVEVACCAIPLAGYVEAIPRTDGRLIERLSVLTLGGPVANLIVLAACAGLLLLSGDDLAGRSWTIGPAPMQALFFANVLAFVESLIPRTVNVGALTAPSDGLSLGRLLPTWWRSRTDQCGTAMLDPQTRLQLALWMMQIEQYAPAKRLLLILESDLTPEMDPAFRATVLSQLAWCHLAADDDGDSAEADRCSIQALDLMPYNPSLQGVRGTVLAWTGRGCAAQPLLEMAIEGSTKPADKALWASVLARTWWRRGERGKAERLLQLVDQLGQRNWLSEEVRQRLAEDATPAAAAGHEPA